MPCVRAWRVGIWWRVIRIAQDAPDTPNSRGSSLSCEKIVERYRPLANAHPGEAPPNVLVNSSASGLKVGAETVGNAVGQRIFPPLAIVQDCNWRPGMTASLDVWRWSGRDFLHECQVSLGYQPRFTKETFNDWDESCEGDACEELRQAAFKLATEGDPAALKDASLDPLTPEQREEFKGMAETFESQPRTPASSDAFSIPFLNKGQLHLVSIEHYAIGPRDYADYSVLLEELKDGKLVFQGAFSVGSSKGDLESIAASGP
jgi:hypothetical protein